MQAYYLSQGLIWLMLGQRPRYNIRALDMVRRFSGKRPVLINNSFCSVESFKFSPTILDQRLITHDFGDLSICNFEVGEFP